MSNDLVVQDELSVEDVRKQVAKVQLLMKDLMQKDEHYGVIPGTKKPTLYKAGAEKLGFIFRLRPEYLIERIELPHGHREYEVTCTLYHIGTNMQISQGVGNCSTMESKYRYRNAERTCPKCGAKAIIKGREEYGGGWLCFKKKGGCGAKFGDEAPEIVDQGVGKIENIDIADCYNTVKKIAKKRAFVDSTITGCAASDVFSQDLEDLSIVEATATEIVPPKPTNKQPPKSTLLETTTKESEIPMKPDPKHRSPQKNDSRPVKCGKYYWLCQDGIDAMLNEGIINQAQHSGKTMALNMLVKNLDALHKMYEDVKSDYNLGMAALADHAHQPADGNMDEPDEAPTPEPDLDPESEKSNPADADLF